MVHHTHVEYDRTADHCCICITKSAHVERFVTCMRPSGGCHLGMPPHPTPGSAELSSPGRGMDMHGEGISPIIGDY